MNRAVMPITAMLIATALFAAGCGTRLGGSPAATVSATPAARAVTYASPAELYRAIEATGGLKVEGFESQGQAAFPARAHARRASFFAAGPEGLFTLADGSPADYVIVAVFPDAASRDAGLVFGERLAETGNGFVRQLVGPNWALWAVEGDVMTLLRQSIGGKLTHVSAPES